MSEIFDNAPNKQPEEVLPPELRSFLPELARIMLICGVEPNQEFVDFDAGDDKFPVVLDGSNSISEGGESPEISFFMSAQRKWEEATGGKGSGDFEHDLVLLINAIKAQGGPTAVVEADRARNEQ